MGQAHATPFLCRTKKITKIYTSIFAIKPLHFMKLGKFLRKSSNHSLCEFLFYVFLATTSFDEFSVVPLLRTTR